jgi:hypothetical protein
MINRRSAGRLKRSMRPSVTQGSIPCPFHRLETFTSAAKTFEGAPPRRHRKVKVLERHVNSHSCASFPAAAARSQSLACCRSQARRPHALSAFVDRVHLSRIRCAGCFGQRFYFVIIQSAQAAHCQRPLASNLFERSAARGIAAAAAFCLIFAAGCADSLVRSNIPFGSHEFSDKFESKQLHAALCAGGRAGAPQMR